MGVWLHPTDGSYARVSRGSQLVGRACSHRVGSVLRFPRRVGCRHPFSWLWDSWQVLPRCMLPGSHLQTQKWPSDKANLRNTQLVLTYILEPLVGVPVHRSCQVVGERYLE